MKKVLFMTTNYHLMDDFSSRLKNDKIESSVTDYSRLDFIIDGNNAKISIRDTGQDLADFDVIICISLPQCDKLISIYSAVGCYCRKKGVKMLDDTFVSTLGKLYGAWRLWECDIPVPKTAYGDIEFLSKKLKDFNSIGVLKAINGTKGRDNFLVRSSADIANILSDRDPRDFILQNYIPNDGDYRIIAIGYEPKMAIYRTSNGKDHRNNTSLGGHADIAPLTDELCAIAEKAAKALDIKFAGVDIIVDKNTGEKSVLEVNRTPQFASGAFTDKKYEVLRDYLLGI